MFMYCRWECRCVCWYVHKMHVDALHMCVNVDVCIYASVGTKLNANVDLHVDVIVEWVFNM